MPSADRRALLHAAALAPWWWAALGPFGMAVHSQTPTADPPLDQQWQRARVERGGLSLDIPVVVETGTSVPIVLFADRLKLKSGIQIERLGVIAPKNPRPVALDVELGALMSQARLTTNIRLGASQSVIGVALLSDGTLWQHSVNVVLTGSACYDGT